MQRQHHISSYLMKLTSLYKGSIDNNYKDKSNVTEFYLKDAMDQMLKNEKIEISSTKAIGCSIKRYEN